MAEICDSGHDRLLKISGGQCSITGYQVNQPVITKLFTARVHGLVDTVRKQYHTISGLQNYITLVTPGVPPPNSPGRISNTSTARRR